MQYPRLAPPTGFLWKNNIVLSFSRQTLPAPHSDQFNHASYFHLQGERVWEVEVMGESKKMHKLNWLLDH